MNFKPSNLVAVVGKWVPKPVKPVGKVNVYQRRNGELKQITVDTDDHEEAILVSQEHWVDMNLGWDKPVLAVIEGGKK